MKYIVGLLWLISVGIAFIIGSSQKQDTSISDPLALPQSEVHTLPSPNNIFNNPTLVTPALSELKTQSLNPEPITAVDLDETMHTVNRLIIDNSTMNMSKLAKAYNLIQKLDEQQLIAALNSIDPNTTDPKQMKLLSLFLNRFAELQPKDAMAFIENNMHATNTKKMAHATVLAAWSEADPLAALDWVKSNPSTHQVNRRNSGLFAIFEGLARQDIYLAMDNLEPFMDNANSINSAVSGLASTLTSTDEFERLLDKTKDLDSKKLTQSVIREWAKKDPEQALQWLTNVADAKEKRGLEERLYRTWLYTDSDTAASSYMASADSSNIQSKAKFVAKHLSYISPDKALNWIQNQTEIDTAPLMRNLVKDSAYRNPVFAAKHLDIFTDKKDIIDRSTSIYLGFERNSQNQANNFLAASDYKNEIEAAIEQRKARIKKYKK